jgi:predicted transcriptional regulator
MKEHVAEIVAAYVRKNRIDTAALAGLITSVSESLAGLGKQPSAPPPPLTPAVPIRRSVTPEAVICLECGFKAVMLRQHVAKAHGLNADAYRQKWGLAADHPLVAKNYSARRSELAKSLGFGQRGRSARRQAGGL